MIGWLLKTLTHRVKTEIAEWRSSNTVIQENSYGRLQGIIVGIAEHPLIWLLLVLIILCVVSAGLCFAPGGWLPKVPINFTRTDLIMYFSVLWSIQGTVAALVYPIVIAFVTLLLQRRHSAKSILHIYLHDSAGIGSGLSALFLLILMALQYLCLTLIRVETGISWLFVDGFWFLANLGLTSFFLYRTFEFVRSPRRAEIVRRYATNVTWPQELREHLASHFFVSAVREKLLPGPDYSSEAEEKVPSVWLGPSGLSIGVPTVEILVPPDSRLIDIRFRFLKWSTTLWLRRAFRGGLTKEKESSKPLLFRYHNETPVLLYPVDPGSTYSGNTVVCQVIGSVPVSWVERLFIRWAFKFRRSPSPLELTTSDILDDLKAEALLALQAGELQTFSDAVDELVDLYILLIEASAFKNTEGNLDNYAGVSDRHHVFGRPVYKSWSRRFVDLFEAASDRVSSNEAFFVDLISVPGSLFSRLGDFAQPDILAHFVELPPVLFRRLASWWVKTLEQQGVTEHDANNASSLRPPFFGTYDSILREFVGLWESLKNDQFPPRTDETPSWSDLREAGRYFDYHLHATAAMVIECVLRGDKTGAEWTLDVLLKWFPELQFHFDAHSYFFRLEKLITFEVTGRSWEETKGVLDVEEGGYIQGSAPKGLFAVALRNYWIDVCCVVAYTLGAWGKDCSSDRSLLVRILSALVYGEAPRSGGLDVGSVKPVSNANDLFIAILRQYHSEGAYRRGYRARLDRLVERLAEATKGKMVPGRIYSGSGVDDLDSVRDGQFILLTLLVPEGWNPIAEVEQTMRKWVREDDAKLRELVNDLREWKERVAKPDFAGYKELFEHVKGSRPGTSFNEATARLSAGIDELITKVEAIRAEAIRDLPVNEAHLEEVGKWASARGFSKTSGAFPLPLFGVVSTSGKELQSRSLVLRGVAKGEYTEPPMAQRAVNEEEWFGEMVQKHVAASVLEEVLKRLTPQEEDGKSPDVYWEQMKRYADHTIRAGKHAILLIENRTVPHWIYEWTDPYRKRPEETPPDLEVWRDPELKSDSYISNVNNIAVYRAPIPQGASYLLAAESFKSLTFTLLSNNNFVHVEALPSGAETAVIDLRLTWRFAIELDAYPAVKLNYLGQGLRRGRKAVS